MLIIRNADQSDANSIARVHVDVWQEHYRGLMPDAILDSQKYETREKRWFVTLSKTNQAAGVFVFDEDGKIFGFCHVGPSRDKNASKDMGELYALYLLPEKRGSGQGFALLNRGMDYLRKLNYKQCYLWVLSGNKLAKKFYEQSGWQKDQLIRHQKIGDFILEESRYVITL